MCWWSWPSTGKSFLFGTVLTKRRVAGVCVPLVENMPQHVHCQLESEDVASHERVCHARLSRHAVKGCLTTDILDKCFDGYESDLES